MKEDARRAGGIPILISSLISMSKKLAMRGCDAKHHSFASLTPSDTEGATGRWPLRGSTNRISAGAVSESVSESVFHLC